MTKEQKKFYDIKTSNDWKTVGEDVQYKIIVDDDNKLLILQFQGSSSKVDWIHNFSFFPTVLNLDHAYVWTTYGYACAYRSTNNEPLNCLWSEHLLHPDYKVHIRGFSYGSAMAKIAVRHFYIRTGKAVDEETTYGDVKCWLNPFVHWMSKKWCKVIHEYCNINDFVTYTVPMYFRANKCRVGEKFSFKRLFHTPDVHTHYEDYDYSKYE